MPVKHLMKGVIRIISLFLIFPWRSGVESPGPRVTGGCECWESKFGPLREQYTFFTTELSLQLQDLLQCMCVCLCEFKYTPGTGVAGSCEPPNIGTNSVLFKKSMWCWPSMVEYTINPGRQGYTEKPCVEKGKRKAAEPSPQPHEDF